MPVKRFKARDTAVYVEALEWTGDNADEMEAFVGDIFDEAEGIAELRFSAEAIWRLRPGHWVVNEERVHGGFAVRIADDFASKYIEIPPGPAVAPRHPDHRPVA